MSKCDKLQFNKQYSLSCVEALKQKLTDKSQK